MEKATGEIKDTTYNKALLLFIKAVKILNAVVDTLRDNHTLPSLVRDAVGAFPTVDIYDSPTSIVCVIDVPGIRADDLDLTVSNNALYLSGKRSPLPEDLQKLLPKNSVYTETERWAGDFHRVVRFPKDIEVDMGSVSVTGKNGVLLVSIKKMASSQKKKILVKYDD